MPLPVMARLVRPPVPAHAATGGPDEPGHNEPERFPMAVNTLIYKAF
jgi:hypothetical protein